MTTSRRSLLALPGLAAAAALAPAGRAAADAVAGPGLVDALLKAADDFAVEFGYPDLSVHRGEYHRHILGLFAQGYVQTFATRMDYPDWAPHTGSLFPWGSPGPDTIYQYVPIDPGGLYKVTGIQGTETIGSIQFRAGGPLAGGAHTTSLNEIDVNALPVGPDRRFTLWMGGGETKPAGAGDPWFAISPKATGLLARHVATSPKQVDGAWSIRRLDKTPGSVVRTDAENAELLAKAVAFTLDENKLILRVMKGLRDEGYINKLKPEQWTYAGGLATQRYAAGLFALKDDEALIVDAIVPAGSPYWSMQLFDPFNAGIDPIFHQSSLNNDNSHVDADGHVRFVICNGDPGVPNWLDASGWREAGMHWRVYKPAEFPLPVVTKVKLAELRKRLPAATPRISGEERQARLAARIEQYQLRRRM